MRFIFVHVDFVGSAALFCAYLPAPPMLGPRTMTHVSGQHALTLAARDVRPQTAVAAARVEMRHSSLH